MVLVEAGRYCSMRPLLCQGKVYGGCRAGHFIDVLRAGRWATVIVVALALAWPVGAAPTPLPQASPGIDQLRQFLQAVIVHIDIDMPERRGVCTGWVGWTESARSAVYTAAHCFQPDARYRVTIGTENILSAGFTKWDALDLMALWIPRGQLPVLRAWKHMPDTPFRAMYMLTERGNGSRLIEVDIPRVYSEIRFENRPAAVALPLYSYPGTSGSPIIDLADGRLIGMVVGYLDDRPDIAAVVPAQSIYDALIAATR
ncbi:MAG: trypsin-like peptidase domain-containing protein [Bacillati bacterium ANGP1]|uniref:Trypsin-like peptidase domain-containing protein n=2 Tax=Candidatus Segetimicrobium genomatis TaxID=2569760 RepID=A0A537LYW7_9BACT|nr:MAG: trypsin-like peptidase domain-containing protein [Terrabacteria group bacterium ANGP1]